MILEAVTTKIFSMSPTERLAQLFSEFPGIGRRQARRFVYFLLSKDKVFIKNITNALLAVQEEVLQCEQCYRFYAKDKSSSPHCPICMDEHTDHSLMLVIEKDVDFENIKKADVHAGRYFILGGSIPILEQDPSKKIRARELVAEVSRATKEDGLKEVIIALSANIEGENTTQYVKKILEPLSEKSGLIVSTLGRGLSTGTELEYSDSTTLEHALKNRS